MAAHTQSVRPRTTGQRSPAAAQGPGKVCRLERKNEELDSDSQHRSRELSGHPLPAPDAHDVRRGICRAPPAEFLLCLSVKDDAVLLNFHAFAGAPSADPVSSVIVLLIRDGPRV